VHVKVTSMTHHYECGVSCLMHDACFWSQGDSPDNLKAGPLSLVFSQ
jgi:hypothetical protein